MSARTDLHQDGSKPIILLVEDEHVVREHLAEVLADEYIVDSAPDGEQALKAILRRRPDLIIADVVLPALDGIELVRTLRSTPSTQQIPILLTSGKAPEELRIAGFEQGADGYLAKPYTERELRARIRALLHAEGLRRANARREAQEEAEKRATIERAALLEGITDAFYALDREWRFTYVNQRALEYFGKRAEDLIGRDIWELFPAARGSEFERQFELVMREQRSVEFEALSPVSHRWIEMHAYPTPQGLVVNFRDITPRKGAERELQRALENLRGRERRLELATEVAGLGILVWDIRADRVTSENPRSYEIFGRTPQDPDLSSRDYFERFLHPDDRAGVEARLTQSLKTGETLRTQCRIRRQNDGAWRWLEVAASVELGPDGAPERMIGVLKDITERRQAEEVVREADRRKDEFLAVLAHELRNPLAPIRNGLQIVRLRAADDPKLQGILNMMDRQMTHVVRLVDDLLDISRITHGKLELRRRPVRLTEVLATAIDASRVFIEAHAHQLVVNVLADDVVVDGDPDRLAQVFSNLLSNSAKYTPRGGRISVTLTVKGAEAVVEVQDNGIGIHPSALERVFDMFSQVEPRDDSAQGGLGIGLSLVRTLVQLHDGVIVADSPGPGAGSTFTVRLPLSTAPQAAITEAPASRTVVSRSRRVLIADDNVDAATTLAALLELKGYEVRTVSDGQEAVELAQTFTPDVIFMDIGMPRLDGLEATRRIRSLPQTAHTFIVAVTGWGQAADRRRTAEAGMNQHLIKPVSLQALSDVLAELDRRQETRRTGSCPEFSSPEHLVGFRDATRASPRRSH